MKIVVSVLLWAILVGLIQAETDPEKKPEGDKNGDNPPPPKSDKPINGQIIGGANAKRGDFPWQVGLLNPAGDLFCGGSLVTADFVLTAAHCVIGFEFTFTALLGANTRNVAETGRVSIPVSTKIPYAEKWDEHDIALLKLQSKAPLGTFIKLIRLPRYRDILITRYAGKAATISGWGVNSPTGSATQILQRLDTTVLSTEEVKSKFSSLKNSSLYIPLVTPQKLFVTTETTKSTCFGDSGGPLIFKDTDGIYTQIGVNNFVTNVDGIVKCTTGLPAGYSRVTYYLTWIASKIGVLNIRL